MMRMKRSEQTVNMGMRSVIALLVLVLSSAIPPVYADVLQQMTYQYDNAGNVISITDHVTPTNSQTLTYDDLDRLDSATGNYGYYDYAYDAIGNMTVNPQRGAGNQAYAYRTDGVRPHAVCITGPTGVTCPPTGQPYQYDANGNLTSGDGRVYGWNVENKPTCIATATGACSAATNKTTFVYDGDGGRVQKTAGSTTVTYISKLYECETTGGVTSCSRYIWAGSQRIAVVPDSAGAQQCNPAQVPGKACYYHTDHLGSSSVITDPSGTLVENVSYHPYGEVQSDSPGTPVNMPYKYTGKEKDTSTGLYYYEARYYDPVLARFISPDTMVPSLLDPQALNRYTYAMNNPMYYTDPSGHCPICVVIGIGVIVGSVSSGIQSSWDLKATLFGGVIGGASAAAGYGVFQSATLSFASFGKLGAGIAGGVVAGAAAGGASGVLANMAGYRVNIGLAIASGAAAGGIMGGAGAQFGQLGPFAAAPAAGAAGAAISGADPGMGAAIAAATAPFAFGAQLLAQQLVPAQMSRGGSPSGNTVSMKDVREALDVIGKSSFVTDPPEGFTDAPGIMAKLNQALNNGKIGFGVTTTPGARAEAWFGEITLNSQNINLGWCPRCDLPGTMFHEGVHLYYGDLFSTPPIENRAFLWQYKLEMSLYNSNASMKPMTRPQLYQVK